MSESAEVSGKPWVLPNGSKSFSLFMKHAAEYFRQRSEARRAEEEVKISEFMKVEAAKREASEARMRAFFRQLRAKQQGGTVEDSA